MELSDSRSRQPPARDVPPSDGLGPTAAAGLAIQMSDVTIGSLKAPDEVVFEEVNWSVTVGDFWAIGGLQGCGKSDFIATAAGLMPPLLGKYEIFGRIADQGFEPDLLSTRLRLGLVFDGGQLLRHLTIAENVTLPLRYHTDLSEDEVDLRVGRLLDLTGLTRWADERASALSRNRQQRAGLARALALGPEVLLLDAPLTGLDPRDEKWWLDFLSQLSGGHEAFGGRPMTLVVSCDDLRPWARRADHLAVLRGQRFIPVPRGAAPAEADDVLLDLLGPSPP